MTLEGRVFLLDDAAFTVTKILLKSHILIKIIYKKNHMKKAILIWPIYVHLYANIKSAVGFILHKKPSQSSISKKFLVIENSSWKFIMKFGNFQAAQQQKFREIQELERRKRVEEQRARDHDKFQQVEERRRAIGKLRF